MLLSCKEPPAAETLPPPPVDPEPKYSNTVRNTARPPTRSDDIVDPAIEEFEDDPLPLPRASAPSKPPLRGSPRPNREASEGIVNKSASGGTQVVKRGRVWKHDRNAETDGNDTAAIFRSDEKEWKRNQIGHANEPHFVHPRSRVVLRRTLPRLLIQPI